MDTSILPPGGRISRAKARRFESLAPCGTHRQRLWRQESRVQLRRHGHLPVGWLLVGKPLQIFGFRDRWDDRVIRPLAMKGSLAQRALGVGGSVGNHQAEVGATDLM